MKTKILIIIIVSVVILGASGFFVYQNVYQPLQPGPGTERETGEISPPLEEPEQFLEKPLTKPSVKEPSAEELPLTKSLYNWPMLGKDSSHSGFSDSKAPDNKNIFLNLSFAGVGDVERDVRGLVFENNRLYFSFDNFVYAINTLNGNKIWQANLGWGEEAIKGLEGLALADGKLFVSRESGLYALDIKTGSKLWSYKAGDNITAPAVADNKVYFGSDDYYLYALNFDGTLAWQYLTKGNIHSVPAVSNNKVCFGTEGNDWSVYCLNALTGKVLWRRQFATSRETPGGMFHAPPAISDNLVLIGEEGGGRGIRKSGTRVPPAPSNFYALNVNTGEIVWSFEASDWIIPAPAIGYGKVYFSSWDGNIYALNLADGKLIWKAKGGWAPVIADGKVFVGSPYDSGYSPEKAIFAYDAETGKEIWSYPTEDIPAHLIIAEGKLYVGFTSEDAVHTQVIGFGK